MSSTHEPIIEWKEPPPDRRGKTSASAQWKGIADTLRARPAQWALVAEGKNSGLATHIRAGRLAAFRPAGTFEAAARKTTGGHDIYARYVGEVKA